MLLEKNVPFERIDVDLSAKPDWFLALSPTGRPPLFQMWPASIFPTISGTDLLQQQPTAAFPLP
ncbi:hypothetical protein [Pseudomonas sp. K2I15]|uniref:hypothetical protein n=1 Tax=unclassified Pseudomonas TaxID=196821 RepID=UPI00273A5CBE|nr:hypothetical protein [Pseudomonas sp. K2I15]